MKSKWTILAALGLTLAGSASAAVITSGYTIGSTLLTSGGKTLFLDSAATGGNTDLKRATPNDFDTFLVPGAGFWEVGQTVNITGVAIPIIAVDSANALPNRTDLGTTTFTVRQAVGGSGTSGAGGLAVLGTATGVLDGSLGNTGSSTYYVNFDTPITFVVDANSTSIGISVAHSGAMWLKGQDGFEVTKYNFTTGAVATAEGRLSVAGTVVPEPSAFMLAGFGALALAFSRRRC